MFVIGNDDALGMLVKRVRDWTDDEDTISLYSKMYERLLDNDVFSSGDGYTIQEIVDNDYVNWCTTIDTDDEDFEKVRELHKNGEWDISCYSADMQGKYSYIEACDDEDNPTMFLLRY